MKPTPAILARARPLLANLSVVLVRPKYPENIGAAARLISNLGLGGLVVVRRPEAPPADGPARMAKMATHHAAPVLAAMEWYDEVTDALAPFALAVAATARSGRQRSTLATPRDLGERLLPFLAANRVALVFGPEDCGLTATDIQGCDLLVSIPTPGVNPSFNLAQAVAILTWEATSGVLAGLERSNESLHFHARLADLAEMRGLYGHVAQVLDRIGYLRPQQGELWLRSIRRFLGRLALRSREVKLLRGVCRQFLWYFDQMEGRSDVPPDHHRAQVQGAAVPHPADQGSAVAGQRQQPAATVAHRQPVVTGGQLHPEPAAALDPPDQAGSAGPEIAGGGGKEQQPGTADRTVEPIQDPPLDGTTPGRGATKP